MIRTKSFLISIMLLPVITGVSVLVQLVVAKRVDTMPRTIAGRTRRVYDALASVYPASTFLFHSRAHACALRGLNDAHLIGRGLDRWDRSGLFRVRSNVHDPYYGIHRVYFFLLATGVVDPPDPHPAISAAMAMAEIRIRFMGPPLCQLVRRARGSG